MTINTQIDKGIKLLIKIDSKISSDTSFFGNFGKTFDAKFNKVLKIKTPIIKLRKIRSLLQEASFNLIDEQFDDLNNEIDNFLDEKDNLQESNQEIHTVDLTNMFDHNPSEKEARNFVYNLLAQKGTYQTATEGWYITLDIRSKARGHIVHPREMSYGKDYSWNTTTRNRHNKAAMAIEQIIKNAVYDNQGPKTPKHPKPSVESYYNFLVNLKFGDTTYRFIIDTEKYKNDVLDNNKMIVHMYNIHEDKNTPTVVENYSIPSKNVTEGVFNNIITHRYNNVKCHARTQSNKPIASLEEKSSNSVAISSQHLDNIINYANENYNCLDKNCKLNQKEDKMNEDLTFFKDEDDRNKNGSRMKNPKKVFAGKKAHMTHGASYKTARERINKITEMLNKLISEADIEDTNPVNLYADINFENTTGGFRVQFDKDDYSKVDIVLVSQEEGAGSYQLESQQANKEEASLVFSNLVRDLKVLADSFDKDFQSVLKKNGIVKRID